MKKAFMISWLAVISGCSTFAPVSIGKDTYLIEGGVGLTPPPFSMMANRAREFCEAKGLQMTIIQSSAWIPGRETPKIQFTCTREAKPVHLRPDMGVVN
jgi:hypothetical protein